MERETKWWYRLIKVTYTIFSIGILIFFIFLLQGEGIFDHPAPNIGKSTYFLKCNKINYSRQYLGKDIIQMDNNIYLDEFTKDGKMIKGFMNYVCDNGPFKEEDLFPIVKDITLVGFSHDGDINNTEIVTYDLYEKYDKYFSMTNLFSLKFDKEVSIKTNIEILEGYIVPLLEILALLFVLVRVLPRLFDYIVFGEKLSKKSFFP